MNKGFCPKCKIPLDNMDFSKDGSSGQCLNCGHILSPKHQAYGHKIPPLTERRFKNDTKMFVVIRQHLQNE